MAFLSFLFPLFGWIYGGIKKKTDYELGSKCIKWAWIGFIAGTLFSLLSRYLLVSGIK